MHDAAYRYVIARANDLRRLAAEHTGVPSLAGMAVLEVGSYNVNGSIRPLFYDADSYIGIDLRHGPGVDLVSSVQTLATDPVDLVVSCEALEHDPDPAGHLAAMARLVKHGGHLIVTAAAPGRHPHGCDGGPVGNEYYAGIDPDWLYQHLKTVGCGDISVMHAPDLGDVYCFATKGAG